MPDGSAVTRRPASRVGRIAGWATLGLALAVTGLSLPIDDFWLTLASGRAIAEGADLARAIDLTWTEMRADALNPQWAAQVVLWSPGSTGGALAINAALIGVGLLVTWRRVVNRAAGPAAMVSMLVLLAVLAPHLLARAQSFSIALLPVALLLLERGRGRLWLPPVYAALVALWANLHGAFVVGLMAVAAYLAGALVQRRPAFLTYAWTLLLALPAVLLNPAGAALVGYALNQPASDLIRAISVEWQPSWPWIPVATLFWIQLGLVVAGRLRRWRQTDPAELFLAALLAVLAASSIRHIPWFALATAPMLAGDAAAALAARPRLSRAIGPMGTPASWALALALVAIMALQPLRTLLPQAIGRVTPDAPVAIADSLATELPVSRTSRILNEQVWGGYLAYRLGDRLETAMDGRIEIRDRETWTWYFAILRGEGDPPAALDASGVTWAALMPQREALIGTLTDAGWVQVHADRQGVLLRAPDDG